jgi:hypothetical protein
MGMPFFGGGYGGMGGYGYGGGMGMGSPLLTTLMAGGLGYMAGSNSAQQAAPAYLFLKALPHHPRLRVARTIAIWRNSSYWASSTTLVF